MHSLDAICRFNEDAAFREFVASGCARCGAAITESVFNGGDGRPYCSARCAAGSDRSKWKHSDECRYGRGSLACNCGAFLIIAQAEDAGLTP